MWQHLSVRRAVVLVGAASIVLLGEPMATGPAQAATGGAVLAWGFQEYGALGDGTRGISQSMAKPVTGPEAGSGVVTVAAGIHHSLALKSDGTVLAWGRGDGGTLGDGDLDQHYRTTPAQVSGLGPGSGVVAVVSGGFHNLALRSDGTVLAWGTNWQGQLGTGPDRILEGTPVVVPGLGPGSGVVAVAAGPYNSMAVRADGSLLTWGGDDTNQLGDGGQKLQQDRPVQVSGLGPGSGVVAAGVGHDHSLALRADGTVLAWGSNLEGRLGNPNVTGEASTPVPVVGLGAGSGVTAISVGGGHSLALRSDGSVLAWGADNQGQLGDSGSDTDKATPVPVVGLGAGSGVVAIAAGGSFSLALRRDGSVLAWGWDEVSTLGDGCADAKQSAPVAVTGLGASSGVVAIDASSFHSLAVTNGASPVAAPAVATRMKGWGLNHVGELGDGTTSGATAPRGTGVPLGTTKVSAGTFHSIARRDDGTAWAWGWNGYGQLGDGTATNRLAAVQVPGLSGVCDVAAGGTHSVAVLQDGSVWTWGWNPVGQLGDGTLEDHRTPQQVPGLTDAVSVVAGAYHSLVLRRDGSVWGWGMNNVGQVGVGGGSVIRAPQQVPGLKALSIAAGAYHSLAIPDPGFYAPGPVRAWGWNVYGQLGNGTTQNAFTPVDVPGATSARSVAAGALHSLIARTDGTVRAWGWNGVGQLGDGTTITRLQPVQSPNLSGTGRVAAGWYHSLAVGPGGATTSWGWNAHGQLGDGTTTNRTRPTAPVVTGTLTVSAGAAHTLAIYR